MTGGNVLGKDLRSLGSGLIWDSVGVRGRAANYRETALNLMNLSHASAIDSLGIRFEASSDHYGWLLFAFGSLGLPKAAASSAASAGDSHTAKHLAMRCDRRQGRTEAQWQIVVRFFHILGPLPSLCTSQTRRIRLART